MLVVWSFVPSYWHEVSCREPTKSARAGPVVGGWPGPVCVLHRLAATFSRVTGRLGRLGGDGDGPRVVAVASREPSGLGPGLPREQFRGLGFQGQQIEAEVLLDDPRRVPEQDPMVEELQRG